MAMEVLEASLPKVMTVMQGLEELKVGFPRPILELMQQLAQTEVMEFQAAHSSGAAVLVRIHLSESNLMFDINALSPGQSILSNDGEGWQCMVNNITGDVYLHTDPQPTLVSGSEPPTGALLEPANTFDPSYKVMETSLEATELASEKIAVVQVEDEALAGGTGIYPEDVQQVYVTGIESQAQVDLNDAISGPHGEVQLQEEQQAKQVQLKGESLIEDVIQTDGSTLVQLVEQADMSIGDSNQAMETSGGEGQNTGEHSLSDPGVVIEGSPAEEVRPPPQKIPRIVQSVSAYSCYMCKRKYVSLEKLQGHFHRIHKTSFDAAKVEKAPMDKAHICFICNQACPHYDALRKHLQRVHKTGDTYRNNRRVGDPGVSGVQCLICLKKFVAPPSLDTHVKKEHKDHLLYQQALYHVQDLRIQHRKRQSKLIMECPICGETCRGRLLFKHIDRDHPHVENREAIIKSCHTAYNKMSKAVYPGKPTALYGKCSRCELTVIKRNLPRHIKRCNGQPRKKAGPTKDCPQCHKQIVATTLEKHMRHRCSGDGKHIYMCQDSSCNQNFKSLAGLKHHLAKRHGMSKAALADLRDRCVVSLEVLDASPEPHTYCEVCSQVFQHNWLEMREHKRNEHGFLFEDGAETLAIPCSACTEAGNVETLIEGGCMGFSEHQKKVHGCEVIYCDICNEMMFDWQCLNVHKKRDHDMTQIPVEVPLCKQCGEQFLSSSELDFHIETTHSASSSQEVVSMHKCGQCNPGVVFATKEDLDVHLQTVHLQQPLDGAPTSSTEHVDVWDHDNPQSRTEQQALDDPSTASKAIKVTFPAMAFEARHNPAKGSPGVVTKTKRINYAQKIQLLKEKSADSEAALVCSKSEADDTSAHQSSSQVLGRVALPWASTTIKVEAPADDVIKALADKREHGEGNWVHVKGDILKWEAEGPEADTAEEPRRPVAIVPSTVMASVDDDDDACSEFPTASASVPGSSTSSKLQKQASILQATDQKASQIQLSHAAASVLARKVSSPKDKTERKYLLVLPKAGGESQETPLQKQPCTGTKELRSSPARISHSNATPEPSLGTRLQRQGMRLRVIAPSAIVVKGKSHTEKATTERTNDGQALIMASPRASLHHLKPVGSTMQDMTLPASIRKQPETKHKSGCDTAASRDLRRSTRKSSKV